ncbi:phosphatase PAP2 family protein [Nocardioides currus]|uniref:Inositol phosphorylceramide synthase n=1 Tax=Nocardioides currus TaxID=2133958 RepID=A0A2R7YVQ3_9ACTN|nr:phosphatase PAP2 family protein [Nocardioides currus]PUA80458.1 inositol phosphorylceramide synthase [Nocardioides currus]
MTQQLTKPPTSRPRARRIRVAGVVAYLAALATWVALFGLPKQTLFVIGWMWLAGVAWDLRRPWRDHLAFLRDWWPIAALLVVYLYSRGLSDDLTFVSVHVTEPIAADRWLFRGTVPTEWLQSHLCGTPCERSSAPRWYDVVLTTVYYSHFFVSLIVGGVLWVRDRAVWIGYMRRYVSLTALALAVYIVYPMAPPWMAARDGHLSPDVHRITGRGWWDLGHSGGSVRGTGGGAHEQFSAVGNQVAAMPSLHAALALFVATFAVLHWRSPWRWVVLGYPLAMSFALVYYAEHYVIDILAGFLAAAVVMLGWGAWERRGRRRARRR